LALAIYAVFLLVRSLPGIPLVWRDTLYVLVIATPWLLVDLQAWGEVGLQWPRPRWYAYLGTGLGLVIGLFWTLAHYGIAYASGNWLSLQAQGLGLIVADRMTTYPLPLYVVMTVIAAVGEELLFRGLLQGTLQNRFGTRWAIVVQAFLFALVHVAAVDGIPSLEIVTEPVAYWGNVLATSGVLFAGGLLMGWLRAASGSVVPSLLFHSVHNLLILGYGLWVLPFLV